jgi:hypothetical protein
MRAASMRWRRLAVAAVALWCAAGCRESAWPERGRLPAGLDVATTVIVRPGVALVGGQLTAERCHDRAALYRVDTQGADTRVVELYRRPDAGVQSIDARGAVWWLLVRIDRDCRRAGSVLLRSSDGGTTWTEVGEVDQSAVAVVATSADDVWLWNHQALLHSRDAGTTWRTLAAPFARTPNRLVGLDDGRVVVAGDGAWSADATSEVLTPLVAESNRVAVVAGDHLVWRPDDGPWRLSPIGDPSRTLRTFPADERPFALKVSGDDVRALATTGDALPQGILIYESDRARWSRRSIPSTSDARWAALGDRGSGAAVASDGSLFVP